MADKSFRNGAVLALKPAAVQKAARAQETPQDLARRLSELL